jgi:hypothetical protein
MSAGEEIYPTIEAFFEEHEVSTLINNVGASYDHAEYRLRDRSICQSGSWSVWEFPGS